MTENNQIEEMANAMCGLGKETCQECEEYTLLGGTCDLIRRADILYAKDYCKKKRGEWVTVADYKISVITECSSCKKQFYFMKKGQLNIDRMPFCPNCGADMRGEV